MLQRYKMVSLNVNFCVILLCLLETNLNLRLNPACPLFGGRLSRAKENI